MNRENLISQIGQNSLLAYCIAQSKEFKTPNHIRQIAQKLEQVERGELKKLCIFMPPRHGKSHLASELFPAWFMGKNPTKNIILSSYAQSLANDFGRNIRNQIEGQTYKEIFPEVNLSKDSKSKSQFAVEQGSFLTTFRD